MPSCASVTSPSKRLLLGTELPTTSSSLLTSEPPYYRFHSLRFRRSHAHCLCFAFRSGTHVFAQKKFQRRRLRREREFGIFLRRDRLLASLWSAFDSRERPTDICSWLQYHNETGSVLKTSAVVRMVLVDNGLQPKSTSHSLVKACSLEALQAAAAGVPAAEADGEGIRTLTHTSSIELPIEAYKVLHKLAGKWTDILDPVDLTLTRLKGAMTNNVYQCHWERNNGNRPKKVLVRVYGEGSGLFFDRNDEVLTFERMSLKDQGPKLLGRFPNGRVEEFLRARTLEKPDLRDPEIAKKIAVKLLDFNKIDMPGPRKAKIWERLRDWLVKILEHADASQVIEFGLNKLDDEINDLQRRLMKPDTKIGFCHNDLQYGNIMLSEKDDSVTLIDYEYASYNPVAFDIANHFCEMTADYHSDEPHLLNQEEFPDYEERSMFARAYLEASEDSVSQADVEKLVKEVDEFVLASHLHWALWGLLSAAHQDVEFDFLGYSKQRFAEYFKLKRELFGSR